MVITFKLLPKGKKNVKNKQDFKWKISHNFKKTYLDFLSFTMYYK